MVETALIVYLTRRGEGARGPITFSFDLHGFHVTSLAGRVSKSWRDILRVTESAGFMFIFVERTIANVVPLKALQESGHLAEVRQLVAKRL